MDKNKHSSAYRNRVPVFGKDFYVHPDFHVSSRSVGEREEENNNREDKALPDFSLPPTDNLYSSVGKQRLLQDSVPEVHNHYGTLTDEQIKRIYGSEIGEKI